jgi:hypothetical protein
VPKPDGDALPVAAVAAAAAFVLAASLHLPAGYLLRYARLDLFPRPGLAAVAVPVAVAVSLGHEALVRGRLYGGLRGSLTPGLAAPLSALAGAVLPLALRLLLLPVAGVPLPLVAGHGLLVESSLSLGLTWLALGTGSTRPGAAALAALWILRLSVGVRFHGAPLPFLELGGACAAALLVAWILQGPLAPHRDRVLGAA